MRCAAVACSQVCLLAGGEPRRGGGGSLSVRSLGRAQAFKGSGSSFLLTKDCSQCFAHSLLADTQGVRAEREGSASEGWSENEARTKRERERG